MHCPVCRLKLRWQLLKSAWCDCPATVKVGLRHGCETRGCETARTELVRNAQCKKCFSVWGQRLSLGTMTRESIYLVRTMTVPVDWM